MCGILTRCRQIVKSYVPEFVWIIFNLTFISFIQSVLLFLFSCVPAYTILLTTQFEPHVTTADQFYFLIEVLLIVGEFVSDGQQQSMSTVRKGHTMRTNSITGYQNTKHQYYKDGKVPQEWSKADLDRGFNTSGLFAYSRHPNFFAEQTIWFVLYQWSCYASNNLYSWAFVGSGSLMMLFQGSTWLTESITSGKYAEYRDYQKQVGMFIPKSLSGYTPPVKTPKIIRTSELAKRQQKLQEEKKQ